MLPLHDTSANKNHIILLYNIIMSQQHTHATTAATGHQAKRARVWKGGATPPLMPPAPPLQNSKKN